MTQFAKMLVFMTFILSIIFTGWSIGIYTSRVDWAPARKLDGEPIPERPGRLAKLRDTIEQQTEMRNLMELRWQTAGPELAAVEATRNVALDLYGNLLEAAQTGKDRAGKELKPPLRQVRDDKGEFIPELEKMPSVTIITGVDKDDKPIVVEVKSIADYDRLFKDAKAEVDKEQIELDKLLKRHKELSEQIAGVKDKLKGLQQQRDDQLAYLKNCQDELRYLAPQLNDNEARMLVLQRRNKQLLDRLKELQDMAVRR